MPETKEMTRDEFMDVFNGILKAAMADLDAMRNDSHITPRTTASDYEGVYKKALDEIRGGGNVLTAPPQGAKPQMPDKPELLTNNEAADFLGITPGTMEVWRCKKRYHLPYYKVGGKVRYMVSDLLAFLESRKVTFD